MTIILLYVCDSTLSIRLSTPKTNHTGIQPTLACTTGDNVKQGSPNDWYTLASW